MPRCRGAAGSERVAPEGLPRYRCPMPGDEHRTCKFEVAAITISCTDVERSERFYREVLGAAPLPTDDGVGWWYQLGTMKLTLLPNAAEPSPASFPTHAMSMLWLEVDDLKAAAQRFSQYDVAVIDQGDGQFMMVADPDGLIIEVWQAQAGD